MLASCGKGVGVSGLAGIGGGATRSIRGNDGSGGGAKTSGLLSGDSRGRRGGSGGRLASGGFIIGTPLVPLSEAPTKRVRSKLALVK